MADIHMKGLGTTKKKHKTWTPNAWHPDEE